MRNYETCKTCQYNCVSLDGLHEDCDPPMSECPLEYDSLQRQVDPRVVNINGEDVIARPTPVEDY